MKHNAGSCYDYYSVVSRPNLPAFAPLKAPTISIYQVTMADMMGYRLYSPIIDLGVVVFPPIPAGGIF